MRIAVKDITIGDRKRKDMGDLEALAASINSVGLLHPVVVSSSYDLICGGRRLAACRLLGWPMVEATIAESLDDVAKAELAELQENICRKDLLPSEMVAKAKAIAPIERESAKERQAVRSEKFSEVTEPAKGKAVEKIAAAVGTSAPTLAKATAVVDAAAAHPEHYGDLVEQMDRTGKVSPAHEEMVRRHVEEQAPPPPKGPTPAEIAKADPERRWCKAMHDLYVDFNSIRDQGGITKLAKKWSEKGREQYATECKRLGDWLIGVAEELGAD